jgi:hypothetical protein
MVAGGQNGSGETEIENFDSVRLKRQCPMIVGGPESSVSLPPDRLPSLALVADVFCGFFGP